MGVVIKLLRNPAAAARYAKKYAGIEVRRIRYKVRQRSGSDLYRLRLDKALAAASVRSEEELFRIWRQKAGHAFIPADCEAVIRSLREDRAFMEDVLRQADLVLENSFYVLYRQVDGRLGADGHYRWFEDYVTQYPYKLTFYMDARAANRSPGTDIKRIWEIARMQYLLAPAMAFRLTGDERYAEKVKNVLSDFSRQNPKYHGPNWNPSMEIGIRAANVVLALELIRDASCIDSAFARDMVGMLAEHEEAILENEENTGGKTSNHYLGGLLGLAAISAHLPFLRRSEKTAEYAFRSIDREIHTQVLDDGGDYEGSTSYHRLVGELLGFALLASRNSGHEFSRETLDRLYGMAEFTRNVTSARGKAVQVGDNDSGRVFQLLPEDANDHGFMVDLLGAICRGTVRTDAEKGLLSVLFDRKPAVAEERKPEKQWLAPQFGIGRISDASFDLFVSCINAQKYGMGGHTHNDLGSFALHYRGFEIIADPGSGNYTGDPELRNRLRSIDSHSAVKLDDREPRSSHGSGLFAWEAFSGRAELEKAEAGFAALITQEGALLRRRFAVEAGAVTVRDSLEGSVHSASMTLVLAPGVTARLTGASSAELNGPFGRLDLAGSWAMELKEAEYSPHYDETVSVSALRLTSGEKENELTIRCGGSDEAPQT